MPSSPFVLRPSDLPSTDAVPTYCFAVHAAAEPGVLPRVMALFAKRDLVPSRWHSDLGGPRSDELVIDIQVAGLAAEEGDFIARCLRQQVCVQSVLTSVKAAALPPPERAAGLGRRNR